MSVCLCIEFLSNGSDGFQTVIIHLLQCYHTLHYYFVTFFFFGKVAILFEKTWSIPSMMPEVKCLLRKTFDACVLKNLKS